MKRISAALLLSVAMAQPAWALTLDEARQAGLAGETLSGYLAARSQDSDTLALVQRINAGRKQAYQRLAEQNNLSTADIASIAGQKLVGRAAAGEYVRGINGQWLRKGAGSGQ
ncbi:MULTISPECIES: YdbL family protein [unclassified Pantoea]|uniref:YdbL family protein n=1 Tax=unclassified Pantoea TaxID=2630326 RepID=UPI0024777865|nr:MULTISPECIES: YdbL family protein [unclassified Pantoea]GME31916.1 YdbL family protein [Pantoea sp. QMID3]GME32200.1 YdbL family protein [Pantoea sp. QMID1]GME52062.1 YdbL family protein [Pantoea sp. QMID4]GME53347.1 YdbL family protein [Pantoea sp. QMID2]